MRKILYLILLASCALTISSCITDEVAPIVVIRDAAGDTLDIDTVVAISNTVITFISDVRDDQDLADVAYYQGLIDPDLGFENQIDYSVPIFLTNRKKEVQVDLSLPDSLYASGSFGTFRVRAEDMEGNVTEVIKYIDVQ